jgi:hypothetical protein
MATAKPGAAGIGPLEREFTAVLELSPAKGGWTYVVMPDSATYFGTRGLAGDTVTVQLTERIR